MNLWDIIKKKIIKNKKYFISILSFLVLIMLGVLGKLFFFFNNYLILFLVFFILIILLYIIFLVKNKKFKKFYYEAIEEDLILSKKVKEENIDYFYLDKIIKIISILIITGYLVYYFKKIIIF